MPTDWQIMAIMQRLRSVGESISTAWGTAQREGNQDIVENLGYAQGKINDALESLRVSLTPQGYEEAIKMRLVVG